MSWWALGPPPAAYAGFTTPTRPRKECRGEPPGDSRLLPAQATDAWPPALPFILSASGVWRRGRWRAGLRPAPIDQRTRRKGETHEAFSAGQRLRPDAELQRFRSGAERDARHRRFRRKDGGTLGDSSGAAGGRAGLSAAARPRVSPGPERRS